MTDLFDQPTRRSSREKKKKRSRSLRTGVIILVCAVLAVAAGMWAVPAVRDLIDTSADDFPGPGSGEVTFEIPAGSTGSDIAVILFENGVVASTEAGVDALTDNPSSPRIQAGTYQLMAEMRAVDAVSALLLPENRIEISITVPEGFVYWQVFERIEATFGFPTEEIEAAAADTAAIGLPAEAGGQIEGWLAPATYPFPPSATATDVLSAMVAKTVSNLNAAEVPAEQWQATLIAASIVEKEGLPQYFSQIARVIDNRLTLENTGTNGLLQMDSTVNYGLGITGGVPTPEQIQTDTPFNTYIHAGLPPTPIGAPRAEAIQAVLNPAEGDWLYFTTVNLDTGETKFAVTYEEQLVLVDELRAWSEANNSGQED
ncbi:MAG: endolytic transglycosylase MltG [Ruaniaceae bacterium]|nr:endolytic transglycosylase MltG [Ruaniaceae bacterium]